MRMKDKNKNGSNQNGSAYPYPTVVPPCALPRDYIILLEFAIHQHLSGTQYSVLAFSNIEAVVSDHRAQPDKASSDD